VIKIEFISESANGPIPPFHFCEHSL